ncbi:hypothetical protein [Ascidiaceihabitans sp.]|uniref:hypothetical protein n=1 Tax=Ascidiaceihabitans sp. TaxID=1872644 RepID=UPI0032989E68
MKIFDIVVLTVLASGAAAQELPKVKPINTSETMLRMCDGNYPDGTSPNSQKLVCSFRIQGIIEIMIQNCLSQAHGFTPLSSLTMAKPPSLGAAKQAYINYMNANPQIWGSFWSHAVIPALSEAFPCEEG